MRRPSQLQPLLLPCSGFALFGYLSKEHWAIFFISFLSKKSWGQSPPPLVEVNQTLLAWSFSKLVKKEYIGQ
jgi:hypothetical protein